MKRSALGVVLVIVVIGALVAYLDVRLEVLPGGGRAASARPETTRSATRASEATGTPAAMEVYKGRPIWYGLGTSSSTRPGRSRPSRACSSS